MDACSRDEAKIFNQDKCLRRISQTRLVPPSQNLCKRKAKTSLSHTNLVLAKITIAKELIDNYGDKYHLVLK